VTSGRIDLHAHTTASDGTDSPEELVDLACRRGISVLGITDHDTVHALDAARRHAAGRGLRVVAGLELSTTIDGFHVHLLAYGFDDLAVALRSTLAARIDKRAERARRMVERLAHQGLTITWEMVRRQTGGAIGRPHIARALMQQGYAESVGDAFLRWIGHDRPAYLPSPPLSSFDAVHTVRQAGGEVALAHPLRGRRKLPLATVLPSLIRAGVTGLEVYYSEHAPPDVAMLSGLAAEHGLWFCGGSDFHGTNKPHIELGGVEVPDDVLAQGPFRAFRGDTG
jgi:hypothetical protein